MAGFTRAERGLVATAAAIVATRVLAFSLTALGFTEFARSLSGIPAGWADVLAGVAFGAYAVAMAAAQLWTGILSDRVGRKPVLVAGTAAFALGGVLSALSGSIWLLVAGRLVGGLGGVSSAALAAVGETVPPGRRTTAMALVGVPAGAAAFLGFVAGPPLAAVLGFRGLFWLTALLGAAAGVGLLALRLPAPRTPSFPHAPPVRAGRAPTPILTPTLALAAAGFTLNFSMAAALFDAQSRVMPVLGGWGLAGVMALALAALAVASRALDRREDSAWLAVAAGLAALAVAAPAFRLSSALWAVAAAGTAFFAAHAVLSAVLPAQVSRWAGRLGGRGHGIQLVAAYLGSAGGAAAAGIATGLGAFPDVFLLLAVLAAASAILARTALRPAGGRGDAADPPAAPPPEAQPP